MKLKWEEVEEINFFDRKEGGQKLESDHELAEAVFEEKDEGVYKASLWYESTLTSEQMARKLATGNSLEVTTTLTCFGSASIGKSGLRCYGVDGLVLSFEFAL